MSFEFKFKVGETKEPSVSEEKPLDIRKLSRAELVDIIYELQNQIEQLEKENALLKQQSSNREIAIESAGSIAEAAMNLSGIFEAAQKAADLYLEEIQRRCCMNPDPEMSLNDSSVSDFQEA